MSASAAKASRREIRRAFGEDAVNLLSEFDTRLDRHQESLKILLAFAKQQQGLAARGIWARLKWLLTGVA